MNSEGQRTCHNGVWTRRVGWCWVAHIVYSLPHSFADKSWVMSSSLGRSGFAKVEDVQAAADAWLVKITKDLFDLAEVCK